MKRVLLGLALGLLALSGCAPTPGPTVAGDTTWPRSAQPSPPPVREAPAQTITIGWVGDTTMGSQYGLPPGDGAAMFRGVSDLLRQPDLMWGNLEGALSRRPASICSPRTPPPSPGATVGPDESPPPIPTPPRCFAFVAPPGNAAGLKWAGFDGMNVCNNHGLDAGPAGLADTTAALASQGLSSSGLSSRVTVVSTHGIRVAFVGFSTQSWWHLTTDLAAVRRVVSEAVRVSDVVVVTLHGGAEGPDKTHTPQGSEMAFGQERGYLPRFARTAIDSGADLIVGSGPHVLRGMEIYRHRLIAYSLGNFAGNSNFITGGVLSLSGLLDVRLDSHGVLKGATFHSLTLSPRNWPSEDPSNAALRLVRDLSVEDFGSTAARFDTTGRLINP